MKPFATISILIAVTAGCGPSAEEKKALSELAIARAASERDDIDVAMGHLDVSIGTKPTFEAYEFRSELFWNSGEHGKAAGDLQNLANNWPDDERLKRLLDKHQSRSEDEAIRVARIWVADPDAADSLYEQTRGYLRDNLEFVTYWRNKSPAEREAYIESVVKQGFFRLHVETTVRNLSVGIGNKDQEARVLASLAKLAPRIAEMENKNRELKATKRRP